MPEEEVRALAFFSLVLTIVSLIFVNRSFSASLVTAVRRPNPALALVLLAVTMMLSLRSFGRSRVAFSNSGLCTWTISR
jgi:Ca2+-transporting ATPase